MISPELEAQILRLHHAEKWPPGTIAEQLGLHHSVVERVLARAGIPKAARCRPSKVDPYVPFIIETFKKYPRLTASRLYYMVRERGYRGSESHFREIVRRYRPRQAPEAYLRLKTLPGVQCQVDWGHFGRVAVGKAKRLLMAFVMVLSYSRAIFLRFFFGQHTSNFLRGHQAAFSFFGGTSRVILYDNLKSAVLERIGDAIRFNPILLKFCGHYRYEPRPVAPGRGNEKPRVERAIRFIRSRFFAARRWKDIDDLNRQAETWCRGEAMERRWPEDPRKTVGEAFEQEKGQLLALPEEPFPTDERLEVSVGKTPYLRFDLNDYSVPHTLTRKTLVVSASLDEVRILDGTKVVATHRRSFDKGDEIEDPRHIEELVEAKRKARKGRGIDRLNRAAPATRALLTQLAERGQNLGAAVSMLLRLLATYGAEELQTAVEEALQKEVPHPHAVRHALERRRQERGQPAAIPLALPDDPRIRDLTVRPRSLSSYDKIQETTDDDTDDTDPTVVPVA
jgi:transposase